MKRQKEVLFVAVGIAIASAAFFVAGIVPLPSLSQAQNDNPNQSPSPKNVTLPVLARVEEIPRTLTITIHDGPWEFTSFYGEDIKSFMDYPSILETPIYPVNEYRYFTIFGSYSYETLPCNGTCPVSIYPNAFVVFIDENTGASYSQEIQLGQQNKILGPSMKIYVGGAGINNLPNGEVVTGDLTLSMYLTS